MHFEPQSTDVELDEAADPQGEPTSSVLRPRHCPEGGQFILGCRLVIHALGSSDTLLVLLSSIALVVAGPKYVGG